MILNIDAIIVANYFFNLPPNVFDALERVLDTDGVCAPVNSVNLENYINNIPDNVLAALKRVLEIKD